MSYGNYFVPSATASVPAFAHASTHALPPPSQFPNYSGGSYSIPGPGYSTSASSASSATKQQSATYGYNTSQTHSAAKSYASNPSVGSNHGYSTVAIPPTEGYYTSAASMQQQQSAYPPLPRYPPQPSEPPVAAAPVATESLANYGYGTGSPFHLPPPSSSSAYQYLEVMGQSSDLRSSAASKRARGTTIPAFRTACQTGNNASNLMQLAGYSESTRSSHPAAPVMSSPAGRGFSRQYGRGGRGGLQRGTPRGRGPRGVAGGRGGMVAPRGGGGGASMNHQSMSQLLSLASMGKHVIPKSPSLTLIDLVGPQSTYTNMVADDEDYEEFKDERGYYPAILHKCEVKTGGRAYRACAESKREARERCSEKAIPNILLERLLQQKKRPKQTTATLDQMEDEVPWSSICSLALYKLYQDWTEEGFEIPDKLYNFQGVGQIVLDTVPDSNLQALSHEIQQQQTHQGSQPPTALEAMTNPAQLVECASGKVINPITRPPIQLLNEMVPNVVFTVNTYGSSRPFFVTQIEVRGFSYTGEAFNKRDSKSICAANALKGAFGIVYPAFQVTEMTSSEKEIYRT